MIGLVAMGIGGVFVPRFIVNSPRIHGEKMPLTLICSAIVLFIAFFTARYTAFGSQTRPA